MKISYNWLKQHLTHTPPLEQLDETLTQMGLEVEAVTPSGLTPDKMQGLVVGEVMECVPHPNAEKLKLTKVNTGAGEWLQIVCGAPNVAQGQKVIVATIGTTLYPSSGESFKIKKSKIRGEESQGMLCAEDEIGLGTSHAGLLILPPESPVGAPVASVLNTASDALIEIGITPNHADACSHLGVAREVYASLVSKGIASGLCFNRDQLPKVSFSDIANPVDVQVDDAAICPRYAGMYIRNVKAVASPEWMQERLRSIGLKPINLLVDCSNFVLHDIGQPIHVFDADKIKGHKIIVRLSHNEEMITTLDGVDRKLNGTEMMICDAERPLAIAGVFGGLDSGVSDTTTNIFIESAYFTPANVRKSARRHGLNTDAGFRFERGTDPDMVLWALHYTASLIQQATGGEASVQIIDRYPVPVPARTIELRYKSVDRLIGKSIPRDEIKDILQSLQMPAEVMADGLLVRVPPYKNDVMLECDLVEEILRVHGLNQVPMADSMHMALAFGKKKSMYNYREKASNYLASNGWNEMMTNSLTHAGTASADNNSSVALLNPQSQEMGILRDSMLPSGLEVIAYNLRYGNHQVRVFESGKTYQKKESKYKETEHLALFMSGRDEKDNAVASTRAPGFFLMKTAVARLLDACGVQDVTMKETTHPQLSDAMIIESKNGTLGYFGEVKSPLCKAAGIMQKVFYADLFTEACHAASIKGFILAKPVPRFPGVRRDLSLLIDEAVTFARLQEVASRAERRLLKEVGAFDIYKGDKIEKGKKSYALYFLLQDEERTLDDKTINGAMQRVQQALEKELGAVIRD